MADTVSKKTHPAAYLGIGGVIALGAWLLLSGTARQTTADISSSSAPAISCSGDSFDISDLKGRSIGDNMGEVTGIIHSRCGTAAHVVLKWTVNNVDGSVTNVEFDPMNGGLIDPNGEYPFRATGGVVPGAASYTVTVAQVSP